MDSVILRVRVVESSLKNSPAARADLYTIGKVSLRGLSIDASAYDAWCRKHFHPFSPGELVHQAAKPIAKLLNLKPCHGCAERRLKLNR